MEVLYEDNHLLVINKPAMLPTMGVPDDRASVLSEAKRYLKHKYHKPGNVYLGVVSRLDAPVTGVLLIARTSKAASRLSKRFRDHQVEKIYHTIVDGSPTPGEGHCHHWLRKDERHRRMHVTQQDVATAQEAKLQYRLLRELQQGMSLLEVRLETGRKHQIRVQLSAMGHPILGDRKYRSRHPFPRGIALHSQCLAFQHPIRDEPVRVEAAPPESWRSWLGSSSTT